MKERYEELVNTFVNIQEAHTAITNGPNGYSYLKIGGAEGIRTPDPLLAKQINMKKFSTEEIGKLGLYEFQGYIGSMTSPTFGGWKGTNRLIELFGIEGMEKPTVIWSLGLFATNLRNLIAVNYQHGVLIKPLYVLRVVKMLGNVTLESF